MFSRRKSGGAEAPSAGTVEGQGAEEALQESAAPDEPAPLKEADLGRFKPSPYLDMDVERIIEIQSKNVRHLKQFSLGSIIFLGVIVLIVLLRGNFFISLICILAYFVACRSTITNERRSMNSLWDSVATILTMDCDPQKYLAVLDGLIADPHVVPKGKSGSQMRENLSIWRGLCLSLMGENDEAREAISGYDKGNPRGRSSERVRAYNQAGVRLFIVVNEQDKAGIDEVTDTADKLYDKMVLHDPLCKPSELLLLDARCQQALVGGKYEEALEIAEELLDKVITKQQCLNTLFARGRALEGLGRVEDASRDFGCVAAEGGSLFVRKKARDWCDEHPEFACLPEKDGAEDTAAGDASEEGDGSAVAPELEGTSEDADDGAGATSTPEDAGGLSEAGADAEDAGEGE